MSRRSCKMAMAVKQRGADILSRVGASTSRSRLIESSGCQSVACEMSCYVMSLRMDFEI